MHNTLLALAVAAILALVAAIAGPLVVDWANHRSLFEAEASRLMGSEVRVAGAIDARLLPSPRVMLRDVEIGAEPRLRMRSVAVEFALMPLLRGQWRISEMTVSGPQFQAGLDASGRLAGLDIAPTLDPDAVSIERLTVEDGRLAFGEPDNAADLVLTKLWFNGELRSLAGPLRGEGAATVGGELYPYRISLGRAGSDGTLRLRLNIDPTNVPLGVETEGALSFAGGGPRYEGTLNVSRPVGIARGGDALVTQPWRGGGTIKVTAASALMEKAELQFGAEDSGTKLTGAAEFRFGREPRLDGVFSARAIDLDQIAGSDAALPPAATLRRLAAVAAGVFRPPFPVALGIGVEQVTLGGRNIQALRGDISSDASGWTLDRFEFRAPGQSEVRLYGALAVAPGSVNFTGPVDIAAADANGLAAWLEGRAQQPGGAPRALRLRGDLTLGSEKVAIERLDAAIDRDAVTGRLAYVFGQGGAAARLDAVLQARELDLDQAFAFVNAALSSSAIERPGEATLAVDIARARIGGFDAVNISAQLKLQAGQFDIARLSVDDLGGAGIAMTGQVALSPVPRGAVKIDFAARDLGAAAALIGRASPPLAQALSRIAPVVTPAKLAARISLDGASPVNRATLAIDGTAGAIRLDLKGQANADLAALNDSTVRVQTRLDATDGGALITLLGLERTVAVSKEPGMLMLSASGPVFGDLQAVGRINAGGLGASVNGTLRAGDGPSGSMYANIERADLAPLFGGKIKSVPVALTTRLAVAAGEMTLEDVSAVVAGSRLRGRLALGLERPRRIAGELSADTLDLASVVGAAIGVLPGAPASREAAWIWPSEPFAAGASGEFEGVVGLTAARASAGGYDLRDLRTTLRLSAGGLAFEGLAAQFAGGTLRGAASFQPGTLGLAMGLNLVLKDVSAEALSPQAARPPVSGKVDAQLRVEGSGRSTVALVGALRGGGEVTLTQGQLAALDPRVFETITRAVDNGMAIDSGKIAGLAGGALDTGQLAVKRGRAEIAIETGQLRLVKAVIEGEGADASLTGGIDLTAGTMDLRIVLSGAAGATTGRPDIFLSLRGPVAAPARRIDVSALTGWLTMRAVERQAKRLEQIESPPRPTTPVRKNAAPAAPPLQLHPQN